MSSVPGNRRLSAVLIADIAGYTKLVEQDTDGTVAAWTSAREGVIDPEIGNRAGRIVKYTGDGFLAEFPNVQDAVECAIAMQAGLADSPLDFRMGVNLGDIVDDGRDIHGEGVNIAARIEALAEPGGISISGMVFDSVRNRIEMTFEDFGEHEVKHVSAPVRVYRLAGPGSATPVLEAESRSHVETDKPSVAVLPFDNMSRDSDHEYFADGITEEIITALSKISQMRVIARNSTFAYKGQARDLRQVAEELGVRYILEGSVRSGGSRLRITAQLIDAKDGSHIWAERFDRTVDDIFDIQDEITKETVAALQVKLTHGEEAAVWARGTNDIEAWQLGVHAYELFARLNTTDYLEARALSEKAIARDPNYAFAWAVQGLTFWHEARLGGKNQTARLKRAEECAERANELDPDSSMGIALNVHLAGMMGRLSESLAIARRGLELYPGSADIRVFLAFALTRNGLYSEAVDHCRTAISLNPFFPHWYRNTLARGLMAQDQFEEALSLYEQSVSEGSNSIAVQLSMAYIFNETNREDESRKIVSDIARNAPNLRLEHVSEALMLKESKMGQRVTDSLRKAGFPE